MLNQSCTSVIFWCNQVLCRISAANLPDFIVLILGVHWRIHWPATKEGSQHLLLDLCTDSTLGTCYCDFVTAVYCLLKSTHQLQSKWAKDNPHHKQKQSAWQKRGWISSQARLWMEMSCHISKIRIWQGASLRRRKLLHCTNRATRERHMCSQDLLMKNGWHKVNILRICERKWLEEIIIRDYWY